MWKVPYYYSLGLKHTESSDAFVAPARHQEECDKIERKFSEQRTDMPSTSGTRQHECMSHKTAEDYLADNQ
jgi:hypothetical protein